MRLQTSSLLLGFCLTACGAAPQAVSTASIAPKTAVRAKPAPAALTMEQASTPATDAAPPAYVVGDYLVRVFTLPSRARVTVTERVIAVKASSVVLEITREEGHKLHTIRVELDDTPERRGEVVSASVMRNGAEVAMGRAVYDAILGGTAFAADENEGQVDSGSTTIDVHGHPVDCTATSFRVKVRGKEATMRTIELANSPWGEVAAEVKTAKGAVLYRAEVVDVGREEIRTAAVSGDD
jgi:hypothetical protein